MALRLHFALFSIFFSGLALAQDIPKELLEDEHFLEEFGVNNMTTPSIRKIFFELEALGEIDQAFWIRKTIRRKRLKTVSWAR